MYVLEIIPLSKTAPPEPLSYRSRVDVPVGTLIQVPLRKKTVSGLVIGSVPVREAKATLKSAHFMLSKSLSDSGVRLPAFCIAAAKKIAAYHATTIGAVLSGTIIPILSGESDGAALTDGLSKRVKKGSGFGIERIELPLIDRQSIYRKLFPETALLVVPTIAETTEWASVFEKQKPIVLTGKVTGARREKILSSLLSGTTDSSVIITTPSFAAGLASLMPTVSRIIIERVSAGSYMLPQRPYIDMRIALERIAQERSLPLIYGDYPLPLEYRDEKQREKPLASAPQTIPEIFDARAPVSANEEKQKWSAIPQPLLREITETLRAGGRVAVLAARRGYAPVVICRDCGTTVTDERGRNLSLATENGKRVFRSADGKTIEIVQDKKVLCKKCGSWNLMPLGVGVERVEEELKAAFPKTSIVRIDADTTSARAFGARRGKIAEPGTLIIGTELMIPWLSVHEPVELALVASADSLLALPFWRSRERFVRIALMLAERSRRLIVATRLPEETALSAITSPTSSLFWHEESTLRKLLHYPPFGTLIVIHIESSRTHLDRIKNDVRTMCEPFTKSNSLTELPERTISKTLLRATLILQLTEDSWPNPRLSENLSRLPPNVRIHIDAESFW